MARPVACASDCSSYGTPTSKSGQARTLASDPLDVLHVDRTGCFGSLEVRFMSRASRFSGIVHKLSSPLSAAAIAYLLTIAVTGAIVTSSDVAIARLQPWWRGFAAICGLLALLWATTLVWSRYVPLVAHLTLAGISMMVTVFGVALFRPLGWGDLLWLAVILFLLLAVIRLLENDRRSS